MKKERIDILCVQKGLFESRNQAQRAIMAGIVRDENDYIDKPGTTNQRTRATVHRMVMETFNPIENSDNLVIDHINGIRTDNSLENLRWVTSAENTQLGRENRKEINDKISELIQKYGYEKTKELIFAIN